MGKMTRAYNYDNLINQDLNFVNIGVTSLGLSTEFIIIFKICYMAEETIFYISNLHQGTKLFCSWIFFFVRKRKTQIFKRYISCYPSSLCTQKLTLFDRWKFIDSNREMSTKRSYQVFYATINIHSCFPVGVNT